MSSRLHCLLLLVLFLSSIFANETTLTQDAIEEFKYSLDTEFYPAVYKNIEEDEDFFGLEGIEVVMDEKFFKMENGEKVDTGIYGEIKSFFFDKLQENGLLNSLDALDLLNMLKSLCERNRMTNNEILNRIENNKQLLKTMADICHLFKVPVQWLIFTSKTYGHPEMFKNLAVVLEHVRRIFLEQTDPYQDVFFEDKLDFIINTLDFTADRIGFTLTDGIPVYQQLKIEFMAEIKRLSKVICSGKTSLRDFSTGLGVKSIHVNEELIYYTTNEDLWAYMIARVQMMRSYIDQECPSLKNVTESSLVEMMIEEYRSFIDKNVPYTYKRADLTFEDCIYQYFLSVYAHLQQSCDDTKLDEEISGQLDSLRIILDTSLESFNHELDQKMAELSKKLKLTRLTNSKLDWTTVIVGQLAYEYKNFK